MPSVTAQPSRRLTSNRSRPRDASAIVFYQISPDQQNPARRGTKQSLSQCWSNFVYAGKNPLTTNPEGGETPGTAHSGLNRKCIACRLIQVNGGRNIARANSNADLGPHTTIAPLQSSDHSETTQASGPENPPKRSTLKFKACPPREQRLPECPFSSQVLLPQNTLASQLPSSKSFPKLASPQQPH